MPEKRVRIVGDGNPFHTKVFDETGKEILGVRDIFIEDRLNHAPIARIELVCPEIDIVATAVFTESLWNKFTSYEQRMCEKDSGMTKEQITGASIFYHWLKDLYAKTPEVDVAARENDGWKTTITPKAE